MVELGVVVGVLASFCHLGVGLERVAEFVQEAQHRARGHFESLAHQFVGQLASSKPGWVSSKDLSPPPGARRRTDGSMPAMTSPSALITVLRLIPDARATALLP